MRFCKSHVLKGGGSIGVYRNNGDVLAQVVRNVGGDKKTAARCENVATLTFPTMAACNAMLRNAKHVDDFRP